MVLSTADPKLSYSFSLTFVSAGGWHWTRSRYLNFSIYIQGGKEKVAATSGTEGFRNLYFPEKTEALKI